MLDLTSNDEAFTMSKWLMYRRYADVGIQTLSWKAVLALCLMVCLSLTEGAGLMMLVPLLQLVGLNVQQGTLGQLAQFFSSLFAAIRLQPTLVTVLALYVLVVTLHAVMRRWQGLLVLTLQHDFVAHFRARLYEAMANADWLFFARRRSSDFIHALTEEADRAGGAAYLALNILATTAVTSVYLIFALKISSSMTLLALACAAGTILLLRGKSRRADRAGADLTQASNSLYAAITEHLSGMKTARSYGAMDRHASLFAELTEDVRHAYIAAMQNIADAKCLFEIGSVASLSILVYMAFEVLMIPTMEVLFLLFLFGRLMPKLSSLQESYHSLLTAFPAFEKIINVEASCLAAAEPKPKHIISCELRHGIRLEQVSFSYDHRRSAPVLSGLNLNIRERETTALVGPSGAGKTTIADLVMGLIEPNDGLILVDETPLTPERKQAWREQIGYVAQETFLFHDTVRANLLWARPDATETEIYQALELAAADEFVAGLPAGLDTVIGDRGVLLSGGERQRLALARALIRKPSLLILDEATSSLDSENERRIQRAIENLHRSVTIIFITHRLSAVRNADTIHVIDRGCVVESGTWKTLVGKSGGRLRALSATQGIDQLSAAHSAA